MMAESEKLKLENSLLKQQLKDAQEYLLGFNPSIRLPLTADIRKAEIFCNQNDALSLILQMLKNSGSSLQMGELNASITLSPLYEVSLLVSSSVSEHQRSPLLSNVINICMNELDFIKNLPNNEIDSVFIFDSLKFRSTVDWTRLIEEAVRVASRQVIVASIFIDKLNSALKSRYVDLSNQSSIDGITQFSQFNDVTKVIFKIGEYQHFYAFIPSYDKNGNSLQEIKPRLLIVTDIQDGQNIEFNEDDLILVDVSLVNCLKGKIRNLRPMLLSALAANLGLPKYQLRQVIVNYDLLESYFELFDNYTAYGYDANLIVQYFNKN